MKSAMRVAWGVLVFCLGLNGASAQVQVRTRLVNQNLEVFFLKDFDITRPASGPPIFFLDLINNDEVPHRVILRLRVESQRHGELSRGRTDEFLVRPGPPLTLSNRELFANAGPYRLVEYSINDDAVNQLVNSIMATGKLPSDVYSFDIVVETVRTGSVDQDRFDIRVSNPQKLDLLFPGRSAAGNFKDCPPIFTHLPQFRWESEMRRFRVVIAEVRPGDDPESALAQEPRFVKFFVIGGRDLGEKLQTIREEVVPLAGPSFQYPPSGEVLTFRPGRTYVWRVEGIVETSSGPITTQSEIYCFRLARLDNMRGRAREFEFLLRNILGADYDKLFGDGGELEEYTPTRLMLNGEPVTLGQLMRRMHKLSAQYKGYRIE